MGLVFFFQKSWNRLNNTGSATLPAVCDAGRALLLVGVQAGHDTQLSVIESTYKPFGKKQCSGSRFRTFHIKLCSKIWIKQQ